MNQFDRVFNGFVEHFPFVLLETVIGVPLCAVNEQRPSAIKYEDKHDINQNISLFILCCGRNEIFIAASSIK